MVSFPSNRWFETTERFPFEAYPNGPQGLGSLYKIPKRGWNGQRPRVEPEYPLNCSHVLPGFEKDSRVLPNCLFKTDAGDTFAQQATLESLKPTDEYLQAALAPTTKAGAWVAAKMEKRRNILRRNVSLLLVTDIMVLVEGGGRFLSETEAVQRSAQANVDLSALNFVTPWCFDFPALVAYCMLKVTKHKDGRITYKPYLNGLKKDTEDDSEDDDDEDDDEDE